MDDFTKVLKKVVEDPDFATRLSQHPDAALKEVGVEPTPQKVQALQSAKSSLASAHQAFGGIARPN